MKFIITFFTAAAIVFDLFSPFRLYFEGGKALMMFLPTLLILFYDKLFVRKPFLPVLYFILTGVLLKVMGSEYDYFGIPTLLGILFACVCIEHYLITQDSKYLKTVIISCYSVLILSIIISIPLFITVPHLSRMMIEAEENGVSEPIMFWSISYANIHALPVYSIPFFYIFRTAQKKLYQFLSLLIIVAILVLMVYADATTPLILTIGIYGVLFVYNPKRPIKDNLVLLVIIGVFMLIILNKTVMIGLLQLAQPIFEGSTTYEKIDEMIYSLSGHGSTGDIETRGELLKRSLDSFITNPFLPELKNANIGRHNFLIDIIVAMGLLLGFTFIAFIFNRIKRPLRYLNMDMKPYYLFCVFSFLALGLTKNFFLCFPTFSIAPMFFLLLMVKRE